MALLLAMYQKMRLIREKNQLVLDQSKISSKLKRVQKNIEKTQKYYTSLFTKLDNDAKRMQNNATITINNMFGFGSNQMGMNPYNYSGLSNSALMTIVDCLRQGKAMTVSADKKDQYINSGLYQEGTPPDGVTLQEGQVYLTPIQMDPSVAQAMVQEFINGTLFKQYCVSGSNEQAKNDAGLLLYGRNGGYTEAHLELFNIAKGYATQRENMMRTQCSDMQMSSQNNISIWLEAKKAELEDQQDAALEPLNYEDTMLQLEKDQKDARLQMINSEIETYTQLVSQEVKNSTPTFGLA